MKCLLFFPLALLSCYATRHGLPKNRNSAGITRQNLFTDNDGKIAPSLFWAHYDAFQRGGLYLLDEKGNIKTVSENPPDAAIASNISALANVNVVDKVNVGAQFSAIKSVAELGKRNSSNYLIRDLCFRLESLNNNSDTLKKEIVRLYMDVIKAAKEIALEESRNPADIAKSESATEISANAVELEKLKLEQLKIKSALLMLSIDSIPKSKGLTAERLEAILNK